MTTDKPSRNEEEYFAKRDAELLDEQRRRSAAEAAEAERRSHYLKCPKCGYDLESIDYDGVTVDRCTKCAGIWLDPGELEALRKVEGPNLLSRIFDDVSEALSFRRKGAE